LRRSGLDFDGVARLLLSSLAIAGLLTGCGTVSRGLSVDSALVASQTAPPDSELKSSGEALTAAVSDNSDASAVEPTVCEDAAVVKAGSESDALIRVTGSIDGVELVTVTGELFDTDADVSSALVQQPTDAAEADADANEYDPWESFNEKMFTLNRNLDRFVLKPVAFVYNHIMPEPWQVMIANGFDNIKFVPRMINNLLQAKWGGAGRELGRFLINSTFGIGGLFDPAKDYWGIPKSSEDFGQTLGVWGSGPGPYLILPFMEPMTVRDGVGKLVDSFLDPLSYFIPFIWDRLGMKVGDVINDRALNYDLFQGFEESVIDMYSAVRHGYLQRRERLIRE
jgi:phospholipid-binding lipoprotein MlaA